MSVQDAKTFVERALKDEEFAEQLAGLETDDARQQFARNAGYDFTPDDVQQLLPSGVTVEQLCRLQASDELPGELMEAVVGGKSDTEEVLFDATLVAGGMAAGAAAMAAVAAAAAA
jgi:predicted ribosomally synthesized peptide with nif11-like leader